MGEWAGTAHTNRTARAVACIMAAFGLTLLAASAWAWPPRDTPGARMNFAHFLAGAGACAFLLCVLLTCAAWVIRPPERKRPPGG